MFDQLVVAEAYLAGAGAIALYSLVYGFILPKAKEWRDLGKAMPFYLLLFAACFIGVVAAVNILFFLRALTEFTVVFLAGDVGALALVLAIWVLIHQMQAARDLNDNFRYLLEAIHQEARGSRAQLGRVIETLDGVRRVIEEQTPPREPPREELDDG